MTPKEKAKELIHYYIKELLSAKYSINGFVINDLAKQCALIAVDEIINSSPSLPILGDSGSYGEDIELSKIYWIEVKQEIEKL
jgi:hypothetical protein